MFNVGGRSSKTNLKKKNTSSATIKNPEERSFKSFGNLSIIKSWTMLETEEKEDYKSKNFNPSAKLKSPQLTNKEVEHVYINSIVLLNYFYTRNKT